MIKVLKKKVPAGRQDETQKTKEASEVISKLRHKSEEEQAAALAEQLGLPYIDTNLIPISDETVSILPEEDSKKYNLAAIQKAARKITLISTDPSRQETREYIEKLQKENSWEAKVFVVSRYNMEKVWEKYRKAVFVDVLTQMSINLTGEDLQKFDEYLKDLVTLKDRIAELPVTQILNIIMGGSYKLGASDVHIEPQEKELRVRYRIDGVLHDVTFLPLSVFRSIVSRIKMMSEMKLNLHDIAQDGAFDIYIDEKRISIRVSIIPERGASGTGL
jgi:type IV pilus assembly protein PilB